MNESPNAPMVWRHKDSARRMEPLQPDRKVFGSAEDGYLYVITSYQYGSHFMSVVIDGFVADDVHLYPILTEDVEKLYASGNWRYARDIWPEQYVPVPMVSPCCSATIDVSRGDGVMFGHCRKCNRSVVRLNPQTKVLEWLDGHSPWTERDFRPVILVE